MTYEEIESDFDKLLKEGFAFFNFRHSLLVYVLNVRPTESPRTF